MFFFRECQYCMFVRETFVGNKASYRATTSAVISVHSGIVVRLRSRYKEIDMEIFQRRARWRNAHYARGRLSYRHLIWIKEFLSLQALLIIIMKPHGMTKRNLHRYLRFAYIIISRDINKSILRLHYFESARSS